MNRTFSNVHRFLHILRVCARHLFAYAVRQQLDRYSLFRQLKTAENYSGPQRLRVALQEIGGTFIKFGQVLALQSDILPLEYCQELFSLLDRVPPFPFEDVESTFLRELGRPPLEIYDSFARDPVATGSIGQVHVATLGYKKLAVKVRRPSVLTDFGSDIRLMMFTVNLITTLRLKALYWMIAPTTEFVAWTREELDYRREARYMDVIAKNAQNNVNEQIPEVFWQYTTESILTTEYFEARTALDYMRAREAGDTTTPLDPGLSGFVPEHFARNLIDNFLGDAFRHGMFHADLHPANLMIMPHNQVGYIDFGIAGVLSAYSRQHLIAMTLAYTRGDLSGMCESFFHVSAFEEDASQQEFRVGLHRISREWYSYDGDHLKLRRSITAMMLDLLRLSKATGIWPQRDVVKYIRSAIALDGLIKSIAPGFNVGQHLEMVCDRHLHWQSLGALLLPKGMLRLMHASTQLGNDGITRAVSALSSFTEGRKREWLHDMRRGEEKTGPVSRYSAVALVCAVSFSLSKKPLVLGFNIQSSILIILVLSLLLAIKRIAVSKPSRAGTA
jgi:ubiquinone biosynthesis protein